MRVNNSFMEKCSRGIGMPRIVFRNLMFSIWCLLGFATIVTRVLSQDSRDETRILDYLHESLRISDSSACRFEGQYVRAREDEQPNVSLFKGVVAKSRKNNVEYSSFISSDVPGSGADPSLNMVTHKELLVVGSKRFRKVYGLPTDSGLKGSASTGMEMFFQTGKGRGTAPTALGLDKDGKPVPSDVPVISAFGLTLGVADEFMTGRSEIDAIAHAYFTIFKFKESELRNDKLEVRWFAVNKTAILTVVLDPDWEYHPIEYRVNLIQDGKVQPKARNKTTTSWKRNAKSDLVPAKITMTENSRKFSREVEISFQWIAEETWSEVCTETNWLETSKEKGTAWRDYFEKMFERHVKR